MPIPIISAALSMDVSSLKSRAAETNGLYVQS